MRKSLSARGRLLNRKLRQEASNNLALAYFDKVQLSTQRDPLLKRDTSHLKAWAIVASITVLLFIVFIPMAVPTP